MCKLNSDQYLKQGGVVIPGSIILVNPKHWYNVAIVLRMAACYGVPALWVTGQRIRAELDSMERVPSELRVQNKRGDIPIKWCADLMPPMHREAVPIGVEFRPSAESLFEFEHPEDAVYVFGPEDGELDRDELMKCHRFVKINTMQGMHLVSAVSTVLYDAELKAYHARRTLVCT